MKSKIYKTDYEGLSTEILQKRQQGKKVVMASGTFDLFHLGHVRLLIAAKQKGDILIVAVKSDKAAGLKKEDPPVLDEEIRMETIANFMLADYVIMADYDPQRIIQHEFDNVSSYEWMNMFDPIIKVIRPDVFMHEDNPVLVNARQKLFSTYGVKGIIQPRTQGISTTEIIDKIKTRYLMQMQKDK